MAGAAMSRKHSGISTIGPAAPITAIAPIQPATAAAPAANRCRGGPINTAASTPPSGAITNGNRKYANTRVAKISGWLKNQWAITAAHTQVAAVATANATVTRQDRAHARMISESTTSAAGGIGSQYAARARP